MTILIRIAVIALVIYLVYRLFRPVVSRLWLDPRTRMLFSGIGINLLRVYLLRRALPLIIRFVRSLLFFR